MSIDYEVRKQVALWAKSVADNPGATPTQKAVAKRMLESISPAVPDQDSALVHVVFLVRAFLQVPEESASPADIAALVEIIMAAFVTLGAFSA